MLLVNILVGNVFPFDSQPELYTNGVGCAEREPSVQKAIKPRS